MHRNRHKYTHPDKDATEFEENLIHTAKSGNARGYRQALARAIFIKLTGGATTGSWRSKNRAEITSTGDRGSALTKGARRYLLDIRSKIGVHDFNKLISFNGQVR